MHLAVYAKCVNFYTKQFGVNFDLKTRPLTINSPDLRKWIIQQTYAYVHIYVTRSHVLLRN